jgi:hypothetical protein
MFAFLAVMVRKANSYLGRGFGMIRALGPGSVSSFLKVILDVFYVVMWIAAAGLGLVILGLLLISFDPALVTGADVRFDIFGHPPGAPAALMASGGELYLVGLIVIVQRLRKVFASMTAGDPFHPDNVRRLRVVGLVLALLEIDRYAFAALDRYALHDPRAGTMMVSLTPWFAVLVVVVLAEVFREGARLRRDAELTI